MLKAIVKSKLIRPEHFWTSWQAEAGVKYVKVHLSMVLVPPPGQAQAMLTLVVSQIHIGARALLNFRHWVGFYELCPLCGYDDVIWFVYNYKEWKGKSIFLFQWYENTKTMLWSLIPSRWSMIAHKDAVLVKREALPIHYLFRIILFSLHLI